MTGKKPRAILVECDETHSRLVAEYLEECGCQVDRFRNAAEALASILKRRPDIVIAAVLLPGMSGLELTLRLRNNPASENVPIILVSYLFAEEASPPRVVLAEEVLEVKADVFLTKPILKRDFIDRVLALLGDQDAAERMRKGRRDSVLIVDDDPGTLRLLERSLARVDRYRVLSAASGNEGLEMFRREEPDVVLLDVRLPDVSGLEVCGIMKQECPAASVILITAFGSELIAVEAMRRNADDYLSKPLNLPETAAIVAENFQKSSLRREKDQLVRRLQWMNKALLGQYQQLLKAEEEVASSGNKHRKVA